MSKFFGFNSIEHFILAVNDHVVLFAYNNSSYDVKKKGDIFYLEARFLPNVSDKDYPNYCYKANSIEKLMQVARLYDGVLFINAFNKEGTTKYLWYDSKEEFIEEIETREFSFSYRNSRYLFTLDGRGYNCIPEKLDGVSIGAKGGELTVSAPTPQELIDKVVMTDGVTLNEVLEMDVNDTFEDRYTD